MSCHHRAVTGARCVGRSGCRGGHREVKPGGTWSVVGSSRRGRHRVRAATQPAAGVGRAARRGRRRGRQRSERRQSAAEPRLGVAVAHERRSRRDSRGGHDAGTRRLLLVGDRVPTGQVLMGRYRRVRSRGALARTSSPGDARLHTRVGSLGSHRQVPAEKPRRLRDVRREAGCALRPDGRARVGDLERAERLRVLGAPGRPGRVYEAAEVGSRRDQARRPVGDRGERWAGSGHQQRPRRRAAHVSRVDVRTRCKGQLRRARLSPVLVSVPAHVQGRLEHLLPDPGRARAHGEARRRRQADLGDRGRLSDRNQPESREHRDAGGLHHRRDQAVDAAGPSTVHS